MEIVQSPNGDKTPARKGQYHIEDKENNFNFLIKVIGKQYLMTGLTFEKVKYGSLLQVSINSKWHPVRIFPKHYHLSHVSVICILLIMTGFGLKPKCPSTQNCFLL